MSSPGAAIGRRQGKADTDNNGLSRYMLKIETPAGIKSGNEPDLSLEYSQATPNGVLGYSWALSGVSGIRLGAPKVVYDKLNPPPPDYDLNSPKLTLDGTDLLNIEGRYLDPGTKYTTEINNTGLVITTAANNEGFIASDNMGRQTEYGTTVDSRVQCGQTTVEWRIKTQIDRHGNTITYEYVPSPPGSGAKDVNTSYIQKISYCSNRVTSAPATRFVKFGYEARPDIIKQTSQGGITIWANRLSSISVGTKIGDVEVIDRTYSLAYGQSNTTGDSCLTQVTESATVAGQAVNLLPSSFKYTQPDVDPPNTFQSKVSTDAFGAVKFSIGVVPLNMTGRALGDLAFMDWDASSMELTARTYIAERQPQDKTVAWTASASNVSHKLPKLDLSANGELPSFMTPDLRGDGRSDLIIPYQNDGGKLEFFLAESSGDTLTASNQVKVTAFDWVPKSKFLAMDMTGTGAIDVIQIFLNGGKLSFRNFPGIVDQDQNIGLGDAVLTDTDHGFDNTIDWFLLRHPGTGAVSLVRVWQDFSQDPNNYQINATSFRCKKVFDSSAGFDAQGVTSSVAGPYPKDDGQPAWSVMSCDINGDGAQDIVLGRAKHENGNMNFTFIVAIADGIGGFIRGDEQKPAPVPAAEPNPDGPAAFSVSNIHGGLYPSLTYVFQEKDSKNIVCLSVGGRASGAVSNVDTFPIANNPGFDKPQVMPVDLNGTGMGGWLLFNSALDPQQVVSVYNKSNPTDLLQSADDPMGLTTTISYGCLSEPDVYDPGVDWRKYKHMGGQEYTLLGAPNHVVTALNHAQNPAINELAFSVAINKKYLKARINNVGRGWLGFESIQTINGTDGILTSEHYFQDFPKTGLKCKIDTFPLINIQMDRPLSSRSIDYKPVPKQTAMWNVYHVDKVFDQVVTVDQAATDPTASGRVQRTDFTVDKDSNITMKHYVETQNGAIVFKSWELCTYVEVKGITGLLSSKRITGVDANLKATKFETGDVSFTQYAYDDNTGNMVSESDWFDTQGKFLVTTYTFDGYGNEVASLDPAGLKTETTYDPVFNNLVIKRSESAAGILITEFMAYDQASGQIVAHLQPNGRLTCLKVDGFGRKTETRLQSVSPGPSSVPAPTFFSSAKNVVSPSFEQLLNSEKTILDPYEQYSYNRFQSPGGKQYLTSITLSLYNEADSGRAETLEVIDCVGQRRLQRSRQGTDPSKNPPAGSSHVVWNYWTYDSRGNITFESFPIFSNVAAWDNFEYQPNKTQQGTVSSFDVLGRIARAVRPSHDNPFIPVTSVLSYTNGGGIVREVVDGPSPNVSDKAVELWNAPRSYVSINGKEHVIASTNQDGMVSSFEYDVAGNIVTATDPKGNVEARTYNSLGQLASMDNVYQRTDGAAPGKQPAVRNTYDGTGQLVRTD